VGDVNGRIEFYSNDLGLYSYDLVLHATAASPEKSLYMRTCLGQVHVQTAKFLNYAKQKTDYSCKVFLQHLFLLTHN
jgi:hydrocephalus-inducing protein